jgi:hypothetical protein
MALADYFRNADKAQKALHRYGQFALERKWSIRESKLDNYLTSDVAFASAKDESEKLAAFGPIYDQLKNYWQVFRPRGPSWDAHKLLDVMTKDCHSCSRACPLTLATLGDDGSFLTILDCLEKMRGIKRMLDYPIMAVSKFMHFFNPKLFPIYDSRVVSNEVLSKAFAPDWKDFYSKFDTTASRLFQQKWGSTETKGLQDPTTYIAWASSFIHQRYDGLMSEFAEWFWEASDASTDEKGLLQVKEYYATAFEFIAIGAAYVEIH